jgi:hypothetical protein
MKPRNLAWETQRVQPEREWGFSFFIRLNKKAHRRDGAPSVFVVTSL